ncbi:MAG: ABC transporter ATP-binding protein [Dehalococcoidia bacterium]|nr:ABC transporter ATP-binding protein [Dehalococcoidia bacterium]MYI85419.1 ABC transporter ATP-binding protein [Dehalococcoidia bacterium]
MGVILRLWGYAIPYWKMLTVGVASMLGAALFGMGSAFLAQIAVDVGLDPVRDGNFINFTGDRGTLIVAALLVVGFAVARGISAFAQTYISESLGQRVAYDLRNEIYDTVQRLSYAYHDRVQTGQIMSRATQDVEAIRMFMSMASLRLMMIVIMIIVGVGGMFWFHWQLALVSCISLPLIAWRSWAVQRVMRPLWLEIQQSEARMTEVADEGLGGIRVVKAFSREPVEAAKFGRAAEEQRNLQLSQATLMARHAPLLQGIAGVQVAATVGVGAWYITQGSLAAGELILFLVALQLLQMPVRMLGFMITSFSRAIAAGTRVFEILDARSAVQEREGASPLVNASGHVRFRNVSFGYDNVSAVLRDIDIDAPPGKVIALLGPTGSGKSTVVNLLPRFYDVTQGSISIDGVDIRNFQLESLRANIGSVQQDVFLFVGTIRDNIAYGRPEATQEEIETAAKAARIHDFIMGLPYGYDEWVGERGVTLSGGQRQRVAIARTLLLDPRVLIFDDSTASVDTQTEFLIQQALATLMEGRTTFVIAQRLRTVMRADEILVLEDGGIVQRGTHEELLGEEGLYRSIYDLELRDQEEALGEIATAGGAAEAGESTSDPEPAALAEPAGGSGGAS